MVLSMPGNLTFMVEASMAIRTKHPNCSRLLSCQCRKAVPNSAAPAAVIMAINIFARIGMESFLLDHPVLQAAIR